LVSLGFVLAALLQNGRQLIQYRPDTQGLFWLTLGVGLSLLSLVVNGLSWAVILRWLGLRPRLEALVRLYLATNMGKFLPGGVWHLASRVQALRLGHAALPNRTSTPLALMAVLLDPLLAAAAALALVPLGGLDHGIALLALVPLLALWSWPSICSMPWIGGVGSRPLPWPGPLAWWCRARLEAWGYLSPFCYCDLALLYRIQPCWQWPWAIDWL